VNLFDPKDYKSISLEISAKNLTSGLNVAMPVPEKGFEGAGSLIQLLELQDKGAAVFGFPKNSCSAGHNLALVLVIKDQTQTRSMSLTAKVISVENDQGLFSTVTLQFVQYAQEEWESFIAMYSKRQQEILKFFNSVKGES
jgi:hypothetical protein